MPEAADPSTAPAPLALCWSGRTDRGRVRENNEDAFLAMIFNGHEIRYLGKDGQAPLEGGDFLFAVSDGMGGARAGEFASRVTVEKISVLLPRAFRLSAQGFTSDPANVLPDLFNAIHRELIQLGRSYEECRGMGTTLSLCWITPDRTYFCHVGDSRVYYLPAAGGLVQLTHDHTHVGWLRRQGKISEREARSHPGRNALHQALGASNQFVEPQFGAVVHEVGDRFVLCTDGLVDGLWDHHLLDMLNEPDEATPSRPPALRLVQESLARSGRDNTTAIVVEVLKAARREPARAAC